MQGTVLGVDGDDLGPGREPGPLHDRGPGDERFLVGQGQAAARLQGGQGDRKTGKTDDGVHHHVGPAGRWSARPSIPVTTSVPGGRRRPAPRPGRRRRWPRPRAGAAGPGAARRSTERHAPRATTRNRSGSAPITSMAWVPIDPVDPTMLTVTGWSDRPWPPVIGVAPSRTSPEVEHSDQIVRRRQDEEQGIDPVEDPAMARAGAIPCPSAEVTLDQRLAQITDGGQDGHHQTRGWRPWPACRDGPAR